MWRSPVRHINNLKDMKVFITTFAILILASYPGESSSQDGDLPQTIADTLASKNVTEAPIDFDRTYAKALENQQLGNLYEAEKLFERIEEQKPGFKDVVTRLAELRQSKSSPAFSVLHRHYTDGLVALEKGNWTKAIIAFKKAREIDSDYLDVFKKQKEAEAGLARNSSVDIVARYYAQGLQALKEEKFAEAKGSLEKVLKLNPEYRNTRDLLQEIDDRLAQINGDRLPRLFAGIDSLYKNAERLVAKSEWDSAIHVLEDLAAAQPNYKNATGLLNLAHEKQQQARTGPPLLKNLLDDGRLRYFGAMGLVAMGIPFILILIFSPTVKARFYLMRGQYIKAVAAYEKLLSRHPERLKLYRQLGDLYLLIGQTDQKAVKVFKTILHLKLNTNHREQLHTIVSQYYLDEKKGDPEAIDILEKALKAEKEKHPENQGEQQA